MSFGINGPDSHMPAIQKSHHTNDGGAGNLGYFQNQKKKKDEDGNDEQDVFQSSASSDKEDLNMQELESMSDKIKGFFKNLTKKNNPEES